MRLYLYDYHIYRLEDNSDHIVQSVAVVNGAKDFVHPGELTPSVQLGWVC